MADKLTREDVERIVKEARENGERPNFSDADFSGMDLEGVDLRGADLINANLSGTNFMRADLSMTDFRDANLSEISLFRADLSHANLSEADLHGTSLSEVRITSADLWKANLKGATLINANLSGSLLFDADVADANLGGTIVSDVDLRKVTGLKLVNHVIPSPISTSTLVKSQGQIPIQFLRGCGLSDPEIEMAKLHNPNLTQDQIIDITYNISNMLTGPAIKYNSCFISYSSHDDPFARKLYDDLQNSGVRCWFAPEDMKIGDKIRHRIDESIRLQDKLLIILSEASLESDWVESEVEHALQLERERKELILFPIRVDEAVLGMKTGWAGKLIRERYIGDFCEWQDEVAHQAGFERLLQDLRA